MTGSGLIRGLFFDMDGTLADTHNAGSRAYQRAMADEGFAVDFASVRAAVGSGRGSSDFVRELAPGLSEDQLGRILEAKHRHYSELMSDVKFNRQLISFLQLMRPGHTTVLVTHAKRANAAMVLAAGQLTELFDHVVVFEDAPVHKPDPAGYLRALELTGLAPDEVIAFEDSASGVKAAEAAGIKVVKVNMSHAG